MKIFFYIAVVVIFSSLVGLQIFLSRQSGPGHEIKNRSKYFGCYWSDRYGVRIQDGVILIIGTAYRAKIINFIYIKKDAAINTDRSIYFDNEDGDLKTGQNLYGYIYRFDDIDNPTALLVPDSSGTNVKFLRAPCLERVSIIPVHIRMSSRLAKTGSFKAWQPDGG